MNTQQLKELALIWSRSEVACMPIEEFSDLTGTPLEDVRVLFGAANVLDDLIDQLESAERERDELRAEQAEHDEQIARMESKFSLAKRALDSKTARCEKAEAELRRRDAAAGEAVAVMFSTGIVRTREEYPDKTVFKERCENETPLYTAAQPAVLPPDITFESKGFVSLKSEDFAYNRALEDARKLGAQQQKVVELPNVYTWSNSEVVYLAALKQALDAAGVKWEVKK